jgi:hypothetical protein
VVEDGGQLVQQEQEGREQFGNKLQDDDLNEPSSSGGNVEIQGTSDTENIISRF